MTVPEYFHEQADDEGTVYWARQIATLNGAKYVIDKPQGGLDNRSDWYWIRLPNGDLVLATYPQGDTYEATEQWRSI